MATIEDVARRAGVARSTVSYALSGKRSISAETRAPDRAGHRGPRLHAERRAHVPWRPPRRWSSALLLQFHEDEFAPAMLQYVLPISDDGSRARATTSSWSPTPTARPRSRRIADSNMVDGIILLDVTADDPRLAALRAVAQARGPARPAAATPPAWTSFDLDFGEAARLLVDHLHERGHRELVLIAPPEHVIERGGAYAWRFRDAAVERAARHGMQHPRLPRRVTPAGNQQVHAVASSTRTRPPPA